MHAIRMEYAPYGNHLKSVTTAGLWSSAGTIKHGAITFAIIILRRGRITSSLKPHSYHLNHIIQSVQTGLNGSQVVI